MNASLPRGLSARLAAAVAHNLRMLAACALAIALAVAAAAPVRAAGLLNDNADFKLLATLGFTQAIDGAHPEGNEFNQYAWSMTWFRGKLYVGTGRFDTDGTVANLLTMTGQIWAYTPGGADGSTGTWALVLQSPMTLTGPREFGYRWMTVCSFGGTEYLFVSTAGFTQGNILRTSDGVTFTPLSRSGFPAGSVGFRTTVCFTETSGRQLLITTPVGKGGSVDTYDADMSNNPVVLANDNPAGTGTWRTYSPMRFNDASVDALFTLYGAGGHLYAGANSPATGAQLWRTTGCPPSRPNCAPGWAKVVDRGGGRPFNEDGTIRNYGISDLMAFDGAIYMGISTPTHNKPPAEMLRLRADGTFEVVIGEPRLNFGPSPNAAPTNPALPSNLRCGVPLEDLDGVGGANDCPPTSRHGAGFGPIGSATGGYPSGPHLYFWRLHHYAYHASNAPLGDNRLYAGTMQGRGTAASLNGGRHVGLDVRTGAGLLIANARHPGGRHHAGAVHEPRLMRARIGLLDLQHPLMVRDLAGHQTTGGVGADVGARRVTGVVLVDAVPAGLRLAVAAVGLLAVAIDPARTAGLDQRRIVAAVQTRLPAFLITERDDGGAIRIDRFQRVARAGLGGAFGLGQQDRNAVPEGVDHVQIVERVLAVLVRRAVEVHALDVVGVDLTLAPGDGPTIALAHRDAAAHELRIAEHANLSVCRRKIGGS